MSKTKKISKSFIGFLIVSILIWLLITLSKEYKALLTLSVSYTNIPTNKLFKKEPIKELDVFVKSTGFKILSARLSDKNIAIDANDLRKKTDTTFYLLTEKIKNKINKQLPSGVVLHEILKDTILLDIGTLTSKKVPVKPNLKINYRIGYDSSSELQIIPDSIIISGAESKINKVKVLFLEPLVLQNVMSNFSKSVKVLVPKNLEKTKISTATVTIKGNVEKYTEGRVEVPFKVINLPKDVNLTTLNKTVEVVFIVGLSNFNKIDTNFFKVICDYNVAKNNNLNYLIPKVTTTSNLFKSYKVLPNKIDFLIHK